MRRRKKPGAKDALLALAPPLIKEPNQYQGQWSQLFANDNPIHIELGMGKGDFLTTLAKENPGINYIGLEIKEEVILVGVRKAMAEQLKNILFIWGDVQEILNYFDPDELDRIYINFCDPWPKNRWAKRRLTHRNFLANYRQVLCSEGQLFFKTDNEQLFEFSLNEFCADNWRMHDIYLDLYRNPPTGITATEYEKKFVAQGLKIFHLGATCP